MLVTLSALVWNVKELREFVDKVPDLFDDAVVLVERTDGLEYKVSVQIEATQVIKIECGDHIPPDTDYDLLVELHSHD